MMFFIENPWMLFGLFALAVPIILHFLQRRRFDTLDWGAMQFLPKSNAAQRKRTLDEILLMLLRMALIALIVIALATPISTSAWLAPLGDRSSREVVVILDGSYSMDLRVSGQPTPWAESLRWIRDYREQAASSDRFTYLIARQPPVVWLGEFDDLEKHRPRGNPDMADALTEAWKLLEKSKAATKEIIILTDRQRHGWADSVTLAAIDNLGIQWHADVQKAKDEGLAIPSLRVVKVGGALPKHVPNYSLAPLTASRNVVRAGKDVVFRSALHLDGFEKYVAPRNVKVLIDGKEERSIAMPEDLDMKKGQIPLTFTHRFAKEGAYVVSIIVDGDDALAVDSEQHAVIDVVKEVPVLLVDGDKELAPESSSYFLQRALSAKRAIPHSALTREAVLSNAADALKPAVIVIADVPHLERAQIEAIDRFLADGGGLLIVAGERVVSAKDFYNDQLYWSGQGWLPGAGQGLLPAKLGAVTASKDGARLDPRSFQHAALELFRAAPDSVMSEVRFPKWWKVTPTSRDRAAVVGKLINGDPFLIEKPYKQGRVILCTVPLDRRWGSTFPSAVEFPILVHELVNYLAAGSNTSRTLRDGAAIRLAGSDSSRQRLTLRTPEVRAKSIDVREWPWTYRDTGAVGIHQVIAPNGKSWSFVTPPDLRESDLTRCSAEDWKKIRDRLRVVWAKHEDENPSVTATEARREELWWLLLVIVVVFLCSEVWMTRRLAVARGR